MVLTDRSDDDLLCPFRSFQKPTEKQEQKREAIFIGLAHTYQNVKRNKDKNKFEKNKTNEKTFQFG